jgi:hypothetical protein
VDARERLAAARGMTVSKQFREAVLEAICFLFFYTIESVVYEL